MYISDRGFVDINQGESQNHSYIELEWSGEIIKIQMLLNLFRIF